jgi:hypothetical protein
MSAKVAVFNIVTATKFLYALIRKLSTQVKTGISSIIKCRVEGDISSVEHLAGAVTSAFYVPVQNGSIDISMGNKIDLVAHLKQQMSGVVFDKKLEKEYLNKILTAR